MGERDSGEPEVDRERTEVDDLEVDPEEAAKVTGGATSVPDSSTTSGIASKKRLNTSSLDPCW